MAAVCPRAQLSVAVWIPAQVCPAPKSVLCRRATHAPWHHTIDGIREEGRIPAKAQKDLCLGVVSVRCHLYKLNPHTVYERMYQLSLQGTELYKIERRLQAPELLQKGSRPRTPSCKCWSFPVEDKGDLGAILAQRRGGRISPETWISKLA